MTTNKYKNIFYAYRGPSFKGETIQQRGDRQIEDNVTKAFINLLDPGNNKELVDEKAAEGAKKLLIGIVPEINTYGKIEKIKLQEQTCGEGGSENTRLDACITFSKGILGIESKVPAKIGEGQLERHLKNLSQLNENHILLLLAKKNGIEEAKKKSWFRNFDRLRAYSWEELYNLLRKKDQTDKDASKNFILEQFIEYLELNGMIEHFVESDFDRIYEQDYTEPKKKLFALLESIKNEEPMLKGFEVYGKEDAEKKGKGRSKKTEKTIWGSIYDPTLKMDGKLSDVPHFTLDVIEKGVEFSLAVEGRITPKRLASGMGNETDAFVTNLIEGKEFERISKSWEKTEKPLFAIYYWKNQKYRDAYDELIFNTVIPIYEHCNKDDKTSHGKRDSYHPLSLDLRERKLRQIINELAGFPKKQELAKMIEKLKKDDKLHIETKHLVATSNGVLEVLNRTLPTRSKEGRTYFRIVLRIPRSKLVKKDSVEDQVDLVCKEAKPLFEMYPKWVNWWQVGSKPNPKPK